MRADIEARRQLGIVPPRFRLRDIVRESSLSVVRNTGRSLMTAIGTVLGTATFVATLGLSSTMSQLVSDSFDIRRATEVRVVPEESAGTDRNDSGQDWHQPDRLSQLRALNGVVAAGRRVQLGELSVSRITGGELSPMKVLGADPDALTVMRPKLVTGRLPDAFHEQSASAVALLPRPLANQLHIQRIGVAIFIADHPFLVAGIFDDVQRRPEAMLSIVIPASVADMFAARGGNIERDVVIETTPGAAQLIADQAPLALSPEAPAALRAIAPPDPRTLRREIEGNVAQSSLVLSIIALIIGSVSIANAAMSAVATRTPEIGLRRAIGGRALHIFVQLLGEATVIGGIGGIVGAGAGIVIISSVAIANGWVPVLDLRLALLTIGISMGSGTLAGLWPAIRAMRITPVAALQR